MSADDKLERLLEIILGIDKTQTDDPAGWWETSTGAEFGASIKLTLEQFVSALAASPAHATGAAMRDALVPFTTFAKLAVDENGWTSKTNRERICDWFGPSDFHRLAAFSSENEFHLPVAEPVAWRWRYYDGGPERPWYVRQTPVAPEKPSPGNCGVEVQPLYAALSSPAPEGEAAQGVEPISEEVAEAMAMAGYDATRLDDGTPQFADAGFCVGHAVKIYEAMEAVRLSALTSETSR